MDSTDAMSTMFGIFGNVILFHILILHIPTFYKIYKEGPIEDYSANTSLVYVLSCELWIYYGIVHPNSLLIVTSNGIGLAIGFIYVVLYLIHASKEQISSLVEKMTIGFIYYLEAVILMTLLPKSWRDTAIGLLCVLVHPLMYKVPCNRLVRVCETKRLEHMSFSGSVHGFLNAGCWLSYGLLRDEPFIITCSAANFVFGIVQLSVYAYYYFNYPQPKSCTTNDERTAESSNAVSEPEKTSNIDDEKTAQNELLLPLLEDMV